MSEGRKQLQGENDKSYFQQEAVSITVSSGIPRTISRAFFKAVLKVKTEIGLRKVEKNVQQFRDEWEKCSRV